MIFHLTFCQRVRCKFVQLSLEHHSDTDRLIIAQISTARDSFLSFVETLYKLQLLAMSPISK